VFGIFTSRAMKERGRYQIQCMKSRSSTGVGQKIDLEYNIETMRITDPGLDSDDHAGGPPRVSSIMNQIRGQAVAQSADAIEGNSSTKWERATGTPVWEQPPAPKAEVQSNKLKQMLAGLKKPSD
jgi:hypothetical protein